jgi:hypothetical protein
MMQDRPYAEWYYGVVVLPWPGRGPTGVRSVVCRAFRYRQPVLNQTRLRADQPSLSSLQMARRGRTRRDGLKMLDYPIFRPRAHDEARFGQAPGFDDDRGDV